MRTVALAVAAFFAASPSFAQISKASAASIGKLEKVASKIQAAKGGLTVVARGKSSKRSNRVSRVTALRSLYRQMAALDYRACLSEPLPKASAARVRSALKALRAADERAGSESADLVDPDSDADLAANCNACPAGTVAAGDDSYGLCYCIDPQDATTKAGRPIAQRRLSKLAGAAAAISKKMEGGVESKASEPKAGQVKSRVGAVAAGHFARGQIYAHMAASLTRSKLPPIARGKDGKPDLNRLATAASVQHFAVQLRKGSGPVYVSRPAAKGGFESVALPRAQMLKSTYKLMAALDYRAALVAGLAPKAAHAALRGSYRLALGRKGKKAGVRVADDDGGDGGGGGDDGGGASYSSGGDDGGASYSGGDDGGGASYSGGDDGGGGEAIDPDSFAAATQNDLSDSQENAVNNGDDGSSVAGGDDGSAGDGSSVGGGGEDGSGADGSSVAGGGEDGSASDGSSTAGGGDDGSGGDSLAGTPMTAPQDQGGGVDPGETLVDAVTDPAGGDAAAGALDQGGSPSDQSTAQNSDDSGDTGAINVAPLDPVPPASGGTGDGYCDNVQFVSCVKWDDEPLDPNGNIIPDQTAQAQPAPAPGDGQAQAADDGGSNPQGVPGPAAPTLPPVAPGAEAPAPQAAQPAPAQPAATQPAPTPAPTAPAPMTTWDSLAAQWQDLVDNVQAFGRGLTYTPPRDPEPPAAIQDGYPWNPSLTSGDFIGIGQCTDLGTGYSVCQGPHANYTVRTGPGGATLGARHQHMVAACPVKTGVVRRKAGISICSAVRPTGKIAGLRKSSRPLLMRLAKLDARANKVSLAIASKKASGVKLGALYLRRAQTYERMAAAIPVKSRLAARKAAKVASKPKSTAPIPTPPRAAKVADDAAPSGSAPAPDAAPAPTPAPDATQPAAAPSPADVLKQQINDMENFEKGMQQDLQKRTGGAQ